MAPSFCTSRSWNWWCEVDKRPIQIRVRAFALVREALGDIQLTVELSPGATVQDLLDKLAADHPRLGPLLDHIVVTVNQRYAARDRALAAGDEVAIFPPVSGGNDDTLIDLSAGPLSADQVLAHVTEPGAGAVVSFIGVVRQTHLGRQVRYLEYEAYAEMAIARLSQIAGEMRERWPLLRRIGMIHRVGHLEVGENAVVVAVGAPHRDDGAFEAARFAIDRIKEIVPIWKHEVWTDGEEWIIGDHHPPPEE
jgi:molybdopterin synthase catalytic subunit